MSDSPRELLDAAAEAVDTMKASLPPAVYVIATPDLEYNDEWFYPTEGYHVAAIHRSRIDAERVLPQYHVTVSAESADPDAELEDDGTCVYYAWIIEMPVQ